MTTKTVKSKRTSTKTAIPAQRTMAHEVSRLLADLKEKVVLAESCTGGLVAATLTGIEGISNHFCGSLVTYRPQSKQDWLGVSKGTIEKCTTESQEVVREMAIGSLQNSPEADWGVAVVGHLGPGAPKEKDGQIFVCIARKNSKGKIKVKEVHESSLNVSDRVARQKAATEVVLATLGRRLMARVTKLEQRSKRK